MMHHPILHLISLVFSTSASLMLVSCLALKAETAARQWPWVVGWGVALLVAALTWAMQAYLSEAYMLGLCKP